jgi:hypothetical protein
MQTPPPAHPKSTAAIAIALGGDEILDADDAGARIRHEALEAAREPTQVAKPDPLPVQNAYTGQLKYTLRGPQQKGWVLAAPNQSASYCAILGPCIR